MIDAVGPPSTVNVGPGLQPLGGQQSLREQVAAALRAALITGQMRPGVVYSAPALAQQFGVSATPVREAMIDLVQQGVVEPVRNKGFRVAELSDAELDDITELRSMIEVATLGRVAATVDAAQAETLRPLAVEIVAAMERRDLIGYVEADMRFHLTLLGWAGNERLVDVVRDLRLRSRLFGLSSLSDDRALESAREHHLILDAVASGSVADTEDIMRRHLGHVRGMWSRSRPASSSPAPS